MTKKSLYHKVNGSTKTMKKQLYTYIITNLIFDNIGVIIISKISLSSDFYSLPPPTFHFKLKRQRNDNLKKYIFELIFFFKFLSLLLTKDGKTERIYIYIYICRMGLIYRCCTSGAEDRSRLDGGSARLLDPSISERVSQLTQAAASRTPTGLGGAACWTLRSLCRPGQVSIRYSSISWWQLLTISYTNYKQTNKYYFEAKRFYNLHSFRCCTILLISSKKNKLFLILQSKPQRNRKLFSGHIFVNIFTLFTLS